MADGRRLHKINFRCFIANTYSFVCRSDSEETALARKNSQRYDSDEEAFN